MRRLVGGLGALLVLAGCGAGASGYPPAWVGTDEARRTAWTADEASVEAPPRETLMDEATLAYADGQTACFDVTVRSMASYDRPLAGAGCRAGEVQSAAEPSSVETLSVYDYADNGDLVTAVTEDVPAESYGTSGAEPPGEGLHRVVERHARLCCAVPVADELVLTLGTLELAWSMR